VLYVILTEHLLECYGCGVFAAINVTSFTEHVCVRVCVCARARARERERARAMCCVLHNARLNVSKATIIRAILLVACVTSERARGRRKYCNERYGKSSGKVAVTLCKRHNAVRFHELRTCRRIEEECILGRCAMWLGKI
jgi:hypothetical protein